MTATTEQPGNKAELRTLYHTTSKNGAVEIVVKDDYKPDKVDVNLDYALVSTHKYKQNVEQGIVLRINSPILLKIFRDVVGSHSSLATDFMKPFDIESPFVILFHHWDDLKKHLDHVTSETERTHLKLLLDYMDVEMADDRAKYEEIIRTKSITFENLWMIFRPGQLQYTEHLEHAQLYKLDKALFDEDLSKEKYIEVHCSYIDYDGKDFGLCTRSFRIKEKLSFGQGNPAIVTSLPLYPRSFVRDPDLEIKLAKRGEKFMSFTGTPVMRYDGLTEYLKTPPSQFFHPGMASDEFMVWLPMTEAGRVVVDNKTFWEDHRKNKGLISRSANYQKWAKARFESVDFADHLLACSYVCGFSLQRKEWCHYFIDNISSVQWKEGVHNSLVVPEKQKQLLNMLVSSHDFAQDIARDQMEQKGRGLIILLHGTPGSGKTLTAETSAETTKRALLSVTFSELNQDNQSYMFQHNLKRFLRYATSWNAIVLIDEADVFLEARKEGSDITDGRNSLVAIFLRHLEYFSGICFLTSNRIQVFDSAVKSRIHLAIQYEPPTLSTRRAIWNDRLSGVQAADLDFNVADVIDDLVNTNMNGREIANTIITAKTLARHQKTKLTLKHLTTVMEVWEDFNESIRRIKAIHGSKEGTLEEGVAEKVTAKDAQA